jgi:hypothetical protein
MAVRDDRKLRPIRERLPLIADARPVDSSLRRARGASRTKPHRAALRGSGRLVGVVDESVPGSANSWSDLCRTCTTSCNLLLLRRKTSQIATSASAGVLTLPGRAPRVAIAPSWSRWRLKVHRAATPFGEWSVGGLDESADGSVHFCVGKPMAPTSPLLAPTLSNFAPGSLGRMSRSRPRSARSSCRRRESIRTRFVAEFGNWRKQRHSRPGGS